ncbi:MAG: transglutaminase family protein [Methylococcaceae bacterium]|nr:transglutaminase family protein [Methylococcaceae bacterium]
MKLKVSCDLRFESVEASVLILMLRPFRGYQQWINSEVYNIEPAIPLIESTDGFGNSCQHLVAPIGDFLIHTSAEVMVADTIDIAQGAYFVEIQHLPHEVLPFLLPSRYCESDRFGDLARDITFDVFAGYDQVRRINDWVHHSITYLPGSSEFPLSAVEVHHLGHGVCRDLAQVAIALCRSISIPARLVVGYLHNLQPMDLHAWFEAYIGNRWYTFDPTQQNLQGGRVIIAFGRDAADVSIFHQFGSGCLLNSMDVRVDLLDN